MSAANDTPSAATRRALPLPPPRPAGRTNAPPPTRAQATPRAGSFAFAGSTPVEAPKVEPPAKPTEATIGPTSFEREEDLAIPRTATSERAVIAAPINPTRDSLEKLQPPAPEDAPTVATAPLEPNPFEDDVWRAEGGSDSSADVEIAGAHPIVGGNPLRESIAAFAKNKRNLAIAGGGVAVLIVLIIVMTGGDKQPAKPKASKRSAKPQPTQTAAVEKPTETPEPPPIETPTQAGAETPSETPSETPAETPTETHPAETPTETHHAATPTEHTVEHASDAKRPSEPKKKAGSTLAGKQVVLEYDTQAQEGKPVPNAGKDDQAAISKARTSYAAGNTRLFAGDADGAIRNYKQALAYYPAYVGAYRGLGLAYAQKGDNAAARKALSTYVSAVPGAKDAPIIRKRIQSLK